MIVGTPSSAQKPSGLANVGNITAPPPPNPRRKNPRHRLREIFRRSLPASPKPQPAPTVHAEETTQIKSNPIGYSLVFGRTKVCHVLRDTPPAADEGACRFGLSRNARQTCRRARTAIASCDGLDGAGGECFAAERESERELGRDAREQHAAFSTCFAPQRKMARVRFAITRRQILIDALLPHDPALTIRQLDVAAGAELRFLLQRRDEQDSDSAARGHGTE